MSNIIVFAWRPDGSCNLQPSVASMSTTYIVHTCDLLRPGYTCTITMHSVQHRTFMLSMIIKYRYSFMIVMSRQVELNLLCVFLWTLFCLVFMYFQTYFFWWKLKIMGLWAGMSHSEAPAPQASLDLHSSVVGVPLITTSCWQTEWLQLSTHFQIAGSANLHFQYAANIFYKHESCKLNANSISSSLQVMEQSKS